MRRRASLRQGGFDAALAFGLVFLGRCVAGPTFGAVLWAGYALPLLGILCVRRTLSDARQTLITAGAVGLATVGLIGIGAFTPVLTTLILVASCTLTGVAAVRCLQNAGVPTGIARTAAALAWSAWFALPAWSTGRPAGQLLGRFLALQPLVVLNGQWPALGDWTHQALAYRWLTRLGQDVAYQWPTSAWPCVVLTLAVGATLLVGARRRPTPVAH